MLTLTVEAIKSLSTPIAVRVLDGVLLWDEQAEPADTYTQERWDPDIREHRSDRQSPPDGGSCWGPHSFREKRFSL